MSFSNSCTNVGFRIFAYGLSSSNNPSSANTVSVSSGSTGSARIRIDATQAHQYHRPSAISRYIRDVDQYNAWLGGQMQANPTRREAKAEYINNWDRNWGQLNIANSRRHQDGSDSAGNTSRGDDSHGGGGPHGVGSLGSDRICPNGGDVHDGAGRQTAHATRNHSQPRRYGELA